ncbi:sigma-54-dependent transcriptional regulator [Natronohydrobacter thiooxidans]|jgi:two-component system repressor protein LuxO|uniref:sigma-54-dependent transcriptional regulator n=1 Tax=Natronohydrobacter thiooxidans TaxID=87172 RepID=UPI0008FF55E8|nr:sigma-54 dependent transcriptional regulator [Natronohydrobacter thiooxidans]
MKPAKAKLGLMLVEDTPSLQMLYRTVLKKAGYDPICASTGAEAQALFAAERPPVVLLDLVLPDCDGLTLLTEMLAEAPETRVIVITANGSVAKAVQATRKGAFDFLVKPLGDLRMIGAVANAMTEYQSITQGAGKGMSHAIRSRQDAFVAQSEPMRQVTTVIDAVARSNAPVFIIGASGSGKAACAEMIHLRSSRAAKPLIQVDCGLPDTQALEAMLFGTGPQGDTSQSAIQRAKGGTLFLRNPQKLTPLLQARLLSVLNTGKSAESQPGDAPVDIRIISAARRDPLEAIRAGEMEEALYYRLFVLPLTLPPLHARPEDLPVIAAQFLLEIAQQEGKQFKRITPEALALLQAQPWEGNLHELRNVLRQAVVLHDGPDLTPAMLPHMSREPNHASPGAPVILDLDTALAGLTMAEIEARAIRAAIARNGGSIPRAAQELDIAPSTIYRKRDDWEKNAH